MRSLASLLLAISVVFTAPTSVAEGASHAIAMHGTPKYPADFTHFGYVNPDAPKGGELRQSALGTFDNLNPFILKGVAPTGLGLTFDTLTTGSDDEAFTEYGLLAETIEMPEDRSWVSFKLRKEARFHDGTPVTPEDVIETFQLLTTKGHPFYRAYYGSVVKAEKRGEHTVHFVFENGQNRELPLIIGQMPVLSRTYWSQREFDKTTLDAPLGSGPYRVGKVDPGRSITYERVADYWGKDIPVNRGRHNFDLLRFDYYRDATVALQAFKAGEYDLRQENISKNWATAYDFPAVAAGEVLKVEIPHQRPTGMQAYVFNTRRAQFSDPRVREALGYAFDFEWTNANLFYDAYTRTQSYYSNSELASSGLPSAAELAILEKYRGRIPDSIFSKPFAAPASDGSGNIRSNLRQALRLLKQAGWEVRGKALTQIETGATMQFEILLAQPSLERITLPFVRNLERLGVTANVRTVDASQYERRLEQYDFDLVVQSIGQSLSPGNEQRDFWGSQQAKTPGSRNLAGINDPVVDELVELVITAPDRDALITRTRVLDRVLLAGHYVIPHWHVRSFRLAYWNRFGRPKVTPKYSFGLDAWWLDEARAAPLRDKLKR